MYVGRGGVFCGRGRVVRENVMLDGSGREKSVVSVVVGFVRGGMVVRGSGEEEEAEDRLERGVMVFIREEVRLVMKRGALCET